MKDVRDAAIAMGADGEPIWHRVDCPEVRRLAAQGEPVLTMFDMAGPIPADARRHTCLEEVEE